MTRGGKNHYYLTDALGSVVALADEAGTKVNTYAYSPRGVQRAATTEQVPQPYRFAGGYQDPTGLYHFAARYYDPNIGRFTTTDPSGQERNPYLYAAGDPVNRIDPTGLLSWDDIKKGGKKFLRGGKPAPAWVALCYTSNSLTDGGSEDGTVKSEVSDLRDCADPTSDFQGD
ncbi:RHS repeat-associated core domain-containing protein [Streptomyces rubiginosohelvolus]